MQNLRGGEPRRGVDRSRGHPRHAWPVSLSRCSVYGVMIGTCSAARSSRRGRHVRGRASGG
jgi:hypothetical protein